jgi:hypothetical protein
MKLTFLFSLLVFASTARAASNDHQGQLRADYCAGPQEIDSRSSRDLTRVCVGTFQGTDVEVVQLILEGNNKRTYRIREESDGFVGTYISGEEPDWIRGSLEQGSGGSRMLSFHTQSGTQFQGLLRAVNR